MVAGGKRVGAGKKPYSETGQDLKKACQFKLSTEHREHLERMSIEAFPDKPNKTKYLELLIQRDIDMHNCTAPVPEGQEGIQHSEEAE